MKAHNSCVTEHDKYAKGATKPGGFASAGFFGEGEGGQGAGAAPVAGTAEATAPAPVGLEFLATRHPWACSVCGVTCTSHETLLGHAAGVKHRRRANAASKAAKKGEEAVEQAAPATPAPVAAAAAAAAAVVECTPERPSKKEPKWKKLGVAALKKAAPKRLKVSALQALVLGAAGLPAGEASAAAAALKAWSGSSKFVVDGKLVGLA